MVAGCPLLLSTGSTTVLDLGTVSIDRHSLGEACLREKNCETSKYGICSEVIIRSVSREIHYK